MVFRLVNSTLIVLIVKDGSNKVDCLWIAAESPKHVVMRQSFNPSIVGEQVGEFFDKLLSTLVCQYDAIVLSFLESDRISFEKLSEWVVWVLLDEIYCLLDGNICVTEEEFDRVHIIQLVDGLLH